MLVSTATPFDRIVVKPRCSVPSPFGAIVPTPAAAWGAAGIVPGDAIGADFERDRELDDVAKGCSANGKVPIVWADAVPALDATRRRPRWPTQGVTGGCVHGRGASLENGGVVTRRPS